MEDPAALRSVLEDARTLGFLGPGPVEEHVQSGRGFSWVIGRAAGTVLDLGSGGGVPGLVIAALVPGARVVLLESARRRCAFLVDAARRLDVSDRVEVLEGRAEVAGRDRERRGRVGVVTARGFGTPATTAECAAPFLEVGGRLVVSEPPGERDRWPEGELACLGLRVGELASSHGRSFRILRQAAPCPEEFPRRTGLPRKRPLF